MYTVYKTKTTTTTTIIKSVGKNLNTTMQTRTMSDITDVHGEKIRMIKLYYIMMIEYYKIDRFL